MREANRDLANQRNDIIKIGRTNNFISLELEKGDKVLNSMRLA